VDLLEALMSVQLQTGEHVKDKRISDSFLQLVLKWQEGAHRRCQRSPVGGMAQSAPSWVPLHVPRTATVSPSAAASSISQRGSGKSD
jgi:hypothetical protein